MNFREWEELLNILRKEEERCLLLRKTYDDNCLEATEQSMKDYYANGAAEFGIKVARLGYFIRKIEEMPVTP